MALSDAAAVMEDRSGDLQSPTPIDRRLPPGWKAGLLLVLLALVPRIAMSIAWDVPCRDGNYWLEAVERVLAGQPAGNFLQDHFNTFVAVGVLLSRWGCDAEIALKVYNVLCGSLLLLPAYGLLRRLWNARIAMCGGLLIAWHPKLIEWSGEIVREPGFLLAATVALYCLWRGALEVRLRWYLAGGVAAWLAAHTRIEGWFVLLPAVGWSCFRWQALSAGRGRLLWAPACFLLPLPLIAAGMNGVLQGPEDPWQFGANLHRLRYFQHALENQSAAIEKEIAPDAAGRTQLSDRWGWRAWIGPMMAAWPRPAVAATEFPGPGGESIADAFGQNSAVEQPSEDHPAAGSPAQAAAERRRSRWHGNHRAWLFVHTIERGFGPIYGLLTLAGIAFGWRKLFGRANLPMFGICLLSLAGIWVHLGNILGASSSRYCLWMVVLSSPFAAWGVIGLTQGALTWGGRWIAALRRPAWVAATSTAVLLSLGAAGVSEALSSTDATRYYNARLGTWIQQQTGPGRTIAGPHNRRLVRRYAQAAIYEDLPVTKPIDGELLALMTAQQCEIFVCDADQLSPTARSQVPANYRLLGEFVSDDRRCSHHTLIYVRRELDDNLQLTRHGAAAASR